MRVSLWKKRISLIFATFVNPWGATNHLCSAVPVTGFESLGGNQGLHVLRTPSSDSNRWRAWSRELYFLGRDSGGTSPARR
jgi:hypothetical protein